MKTLPLLSAFALVALCPSVQADDPSRVLPPNEKPKDARLGKLKTLNDYFPMRVPKNKDEWDVRRKELREQVMVAVGLWPMPEKTPLNAVVHGKIDRDDYTIEKVFFASMPGHYVTGNLYRPKNKGKGLPGVLCPHGHWRNGRFYENTEDAAKKDIASGAEKTMESARYPLQARCAMLARMGCVVFHYDMVGNADSKVIGHAAGFTDAEAELRLQSAMGLQTWNSIRALDFITSLPEVDAKRIGVTGASGGGTQTFILCAVDDRPAVAFPAVMVSTAMQGGCICENCDYLRIDAGNIDLAALFAPKPLGMSGANDWTVDIERKGLPELKALYKMLGAEDNVMAKCFPQFGHNYNQVSRELMYGWMNKHLKLGLKEPIEEKPFVPVPPAQLSVFDEEHPQPKDAADVKTLRKYMTDTANARLAALMPKDAATAREFRQIVGTGLRAMIGGGLVSGSEVDVKPVGDKETRDKVTLRRYLIGRKERDEAVPAIGLRGENFDGTVVVWIHSEGKGSLWKDGKLTPEAKMVLDGKAAILAVDVLGVGELALEKPMAVDKRFAGYTYGYNRPLLAQRVQDILTAVAFAKTHDKTRTVHLVGHGEAGPWVLMARALCGASVSKVAADVNGFRFDTVQKTDDPMMLPGALKYGGLSAFVGLSTEGKLLLHGNRGTGMGRWVKAAFDTDGKSDSVRLSGGSLAATDVIDWLLK